MRLRHRLVTVLANAPMTIGIRIVPIRHFVGMTHFGMAAYGANTVLIKYMLLGLRHRLFAVYTYLPVADFITPVPATHYMACMIGSGIAAYRTYAVFVIRVPLRLRHRLVAVPATMPVAVDIRTVPIRHLVSMARSGIAAHGANTVLIKYMLLGLRHRLFAVYTDLPVTVFGVIVSDTHYMARVIGSGIAAHGTNAVFVIGMICGVKMDLFIFQRLVAGADSHRIPLLLASGEEKRRIPCATERIVADGIQCVGKADLLKIKATQKSRLSDFCQRSRQSRRSQLIASGKRRSSNRRHAFLNDKALYTVPIAHPGCLVAHSPRTVNGQCSITAETPGQIVPVLAKCSGVHDRIRQARQGIPCPLPCKHCAGDQAENHCQCQKDTCNFPFHKRYPSSSTFLY